MRRSTFPIGGLFPPERKKSTRNSPIRNAILPPLTLLPLAQGADAAVPTVSEGDRVREGMRIARAARPRAAHVHSPVPGIVTGIRDMVLPDGRTSPAVEVRMDGEFERLGKPANRYDWSSFEPATITKLIRQAGVVDLTGSAGALDQIFSEKTISNCSHLVVSGVESEPYVTVAHRLMVENASQLVEAIAVVRRVLTPKFTVLAVEAEKSGAMARMKVAAEAAGEPMRFAVVDNKYPQSDERQLIRATTGREVPSGHPGIDVGCVTISVATLLAIWDAVVTRKPLVERIVTVAGGAVGSPANLKVRLGTPIGSLLKECGLDPARVSSIVVGGPMRGHATSDLRLPVTKTTDAVLALTKSEVHSAPETDCIQCGRCSRSCPMGLNPERLYKLVEHRHVLRAVDEGLFDCTECGACSYVCPARIPLLDHLISGKGQVKAP